jgi:DHA1 family multidrug resistance protein-like MFS transporter
VSDGAARRGERNRRVAAAMVFVVFTGFAFVIPFLPLFVRELGVVEDHAVAVWSGVLIGVTPLLAALMAPVWGRLADRHGHKRMALRALVAYVVVLLLTAAVRDVVQLLALRVALGLTGGIGPLGLAMATAGAAREQTGRAVGLVQSVQILSAAIGPLSGGMLADLVGMRATFLLTAGACLLALLLVVFLYEDAATAAGGAAAPAGRLADVLALAHVPALLVTLFLVNFVGRSFTPILPLQLHDLGVPAPRLAGATGTLISCYALAAAFSAAALGRATRRLGARTLLFGSLLGGAAAVLPMASVTSYAGLLALAVALGLTSGGALTLCYTIGGLLVPAGVRTAAVGFFSGAALVGGALSPWVAGELVRFDLRAIYYVDAGLFALLAFAASAALPAVAPTGAAADALAPAGKK